MRFDEVREIKIIPYGWTREEGNEEEEIDVGRCIVYTLGRVY